MRFVRVRRPNQLFPTQRFLCLLNRISSSQTSDSGNISSSIGQMERKSCWSIIVYKKPQLRLVAGQICNSSKHRSSLITWSGISLANLTYRVRYPASATVFFANRARSRFCRLNPPFAAFRYLLLHKSCIHRTSKYASSFTPTFVKKCGWTSIGLSLSRLSTKWHRRALPPSNLLK